MNVKWLLLFCLLLPIAGKSQTCDMKVYGLETSPYTWPYAHITFDTLKEAKTITDLYSRFQSKWVATYHSVKMTCTCGGNIQTAFSKDEVLTSEQLQILTNVTEACNIQFTIEYTPRNNLKENPRKEMVIDLSLIPIFEASYSGGYSELYKWLKSQGLKTDFPYSKVHFTISPTGNVSNLTVIELSGDPLFEKELPSALAKTKWTPAREGSGIPISQTFELVMGTDLLRCDYIMNRLKE